MEQKNNQLGRSLFANTIAILLFLVFVFFVFSNLDFIWERMDGKKAETQISTYEKLEELQGQKVASKQEATIYFWGDTDRDMMIKHQLDNMKEHYLDVEDLSECDNAELLIAHKDEYSLEDINALRKISRDGVIICVAGLPGEENGQKAYVRDFLGIKEYKGVEEKVGYRLAAKVLFGEVYENQKEFSVNEIDLMQKTEIYVSALDEKEEKEQIDNRDIAPLFWRYKESVENESVYVMNEMLLEEETGYAIVSFLMTDIHSTYMYPVINAYCFVVQGMPYSKDFSSEFLDRQYGKDSLGLENDILFPQINRCEERYNLKTTWYSDETEAIKNADNVLLQYYVDDIKRSRGIIGTHDSEADTYSVDMPYKNRLKEWDTDFAWQDEDVIQIPYDAMNDEEYQTTIIEDICEIRGTAFHCVSVDIRAFLDENEDIDWITYIDNLETVLGMEKKDLYWLDRMTVADAVYRIKNHDIMEPEISYGKDKVTVEIENFPGEAFFYLYTDKKIKEVTGAQITEISDGICFVSASEEKIEILFYE